MQEDPDSFEFSDPEVEGPFPNGVSRETADAYIQRKIKRHERIIRYYNGRHNALTITCRIPPEILSSIFIEVARYAGSSAYHAKHMKWIKAVSHVCSHWREVALAAPNLWSNISIDNPPWAIEMVRRSETAPLLINYQGNFNAGSRPHSTLMEILRSHLHRIKGLTLDVLSSSLYYTPSVSVNEQILNLLPLLCQPASMMETLTLRFPQASDTIEIPNEVVLMAPRLQHLRLEGYGMTWSSGRIDLRNLRSLEISRLTEKMRPSTAQLLAILRQMSRLEILKVVYIGQSTEHESPSLLQDIDSINLGYLEQISLSDSLTKCALLLSHIIFSKNAHTITLRIHDSDNTPASFAQMLAAKVDDGIEGSIVKLEFGSEIQFWKSKDTAQLIPFHDASPIQIGHFPINASRIGARDSFLRSLRLHHLLSLVVETTLEREAWLMFGDLPQLEVLQVRCYYANDIPLLKALHRGLANTPDTTSLYPSFTALRSLTIFRWSLDEISEDSELGLVHVMQLLISCFKLRKEAGLPLEFLELEDCRGVSRAEVDELEEIIEDVEWDGNEDIDEETDPESCEMDEDVYYHECCGGLHGSYW